MNVAALIALLIQTGICAPVNFDGQDGSRLTVVVCPVLQPMSSQEPSSQGAPEPELENEAAPKMKNRHRA